MLNKEQIDQLDFTKGDGLIPAIVQNAVSGRVLMLGYMNREALEETIKTVKLPVTISIWWIWPMIVITILF